MHRVTAPFFLRAGKDYANGRALIPTFRPESTSHKSEADKRWALAASLDFESDLI
jgi:hypothetical protein